MKNGKVFRFVVLMLFVVFAGFYIVSYSNYYDYDAKEQIKQFEEDVENGVNIDAKKYLSINEKKYNNNISKLTYKLSSTIGKTIEASLNTVFNKVAGAINN